MDGVGQGAGHPGGHRGRLYPDLHHLNQRGIQPRQVSVQPQIHVVEQLNVEKNVHEILCKGILCQVHMIFCEIYIYMYLKKILTQI